MRIAAFFFLALLSKEMAFTFPVVAVLADWLLARRLRWTRYALLAAVFAIYTALRVHALGQFMIRQTLFELDLVSHVLSTAAALIERVSSR